MKAMTVSVQILSMKVTLVFLDGLFKNPPWKEFHHLREDKFALIHNSGLNSATKFAYSHFKSKNVKDLFN